MLREPEEGGFRMRSRRRFRLLFAHDAFTTTCDRLIEVIQVALADVDLSESPSGDDARDALRISVLDTEAPVSSARFDLGMVCLDLPPAPHGGVKLGQHMLQVGLPVVLVTRSLRWIPPSASALREVPWVSPDAGPAEVTRAVHEALSRHARAPAPVEVESVSG